MARNLGLQTVGNSAEKTVSIERGPAKRYPSTNNYRRTAASLVSSVHMKKDTVSRKDPRYPCAFCQATNHYPEDCKSVPTAEARRTALKSTQCLLCLSQTHRKYDCKSQKSCKNCNARRSHHHSLCLKKYGSKFESKPPGSAAQSFISASSLVSSSGRSSDRPTINRGISILGTAVTCAEGQRTSQQVRVVLDSCSTRSFARLDVLKRIGARLVGEERLGFAGLEAENRRYDSFGCYELKLRCNNGEELPIAVTGLKTITCAVEKQSVSFEDYPLLKQFPLADLLEDCPKDVQLDVMIGLDQYYRIVRDIHIRLSDTLVLLDTRLGYVLNGSSTPESHADTKPATALLAVTQKSADDRINQNLERLWELEDVGTKNESLTEDDSIAVDKFNREIVYDQLHKRYSVRWPWKTDRAPLPSNYGLALGRLRSLLRRLDHPSQELYHKTIQDQLQRGIIEIAPQHPQNGDVHFLPHHCVIKTDHSTTKLRVVYDASAKSSNMEPSLNDSMYAGPDLLADLCGLLMRFRQYRIGIISDLEKAFLQIQIKPVDRDVTRFIWIKDLQIPPMKSNLVIYRFTRVLFGVTASPFLLAGTLNHHLKSLNTEVAQKILTNCYVDNVITGVDTILEANMFYKEAKHAFQLASMNLREWYSNNTSFIQGVSAIDRGVKSTTKVLGLKWSTVQDTLSCCGIANVHLECKTRRQMLRSIAQLFDPCGFLAPITVKGKIILQQLWKSKIGWDEEVPADIQQRWSHLTLDLVRVPEIAIPRKIGYSENSSVQLHCFVDASKEAYAAAIYQRNENCQTVVSRLIFTKVKVSPLKTPLTIPKLELTALALGCRLLIFVKKELGFSTAPLFAWSDSQCALQWVCAKTKQIKFVQNRIQAIKETQGVELRYVPSSCNPADLPSRGVSAQKLESSSLWWTGPEWLTRHSSQWPQQPEGWKACDEETSDASPGQTDASSLLGNCVSMLPFQVTQYSSLDKSIAVLGWTLRFVRKTRKASDNSNSTLTASERRCALRTLIQQAQQQFAQDHPPDYAVMFKQLNLFLDPSGLLRCQGRLQFAHGSYASLFPVFLPRQAPLARLIITAQHKIWAHAGMQHLLTVIRRRYWIPRARSQIRSILQSCTICRRWKGGPYPTPQAPPLPQFRVTEQGSFNSVGVDYLGPLLVKCSSQIPRKIWICLFTCCSTRAIHLEVVTDMTAEKFLLCFRRFVAYRGPPTTIIADNAQNFKLASGVMKDLWNSIIRCPEISKYSSSRGIEWKFIVEFAPWMGGMYERMVGMVKKALRCTLQNKLVALDEIQTVCAEITHTLNSRPLTNVEDQMGFQGLTPNDLQRTGNDAMPSFDCHEDPSDTEFLPKPSSKSNLILKWKRLDVRLREFWPIWRQEYLLALRERSWSPNNYGSAKDRPKIGSVVIVGDPDVPRGRWVLGRIEKLRHSKINGVVRSLLIKTTQGRYLHRPLRFVYPLEADSDTEKAVSNSATSADETNADTEAGCNELLPCRARTQRAAATAARNRWQLQLRNQTL